MALPTDANIDFILCDMVRSTAEGKLDIAGYFPIREVKLDASVPLPAAVNLSFVFVLKDGAGRFRGAFRLLDPLRGELHRQAIDEFPKEAAVPHVIMFQLNRIPVTRSGNFTVVLEIDGQEFHRLVRIFQ
jgi:hypothetical protein